MTQNDARRTFDEPVEDDALPEVLPGLVGVSAPMCAMAQFVDRCAAVDVPILLRGESGTGKEAVGRALHTRSRRANGPFVALNGSFLSGDLGLSAMFGHARGAFTGAAEARKGALRRAHGGTLFIDEVGAMSAPAQAYLLRVIEDGRVEPIGADDHHSVDVRLVTATCEPLERRVRSGDFRADLYQRIAACVVVLPPLRERGMRDLRLIAQHLLRCGALSGRCVSDDALALLSTQRLPGNVRELRNILVHAAMLSDMRRIDSEAVFGALRARGEIDLTPGEPLDVAALLAASGGNVSAAARRAGMPRTTFRDRLHNRQGG
jgi:DNA-binding NtrC family response regulator